MRTASPLPILRLMDRMVRSGATTHWLRAALPTRTSPLGAMPTTEGKSRSSPMGTRRMRPSWTTPRTELVVPRSIPMILPCSLIMGLLGLSGHRLLAVGGPRHDDFGIAQHPLVLAIVLVQHADDRMRADIVPDLCLDGNVQMWIKGSMQRRHDLNALAGQDGQEALAHQRQPLQPGIQDVRHGRHGLRQRTRRGWGQRDRDSLTGKFSAQLLPGAGGGRRPLRRLGGPGLLLPRGNLLALPYHQRLAAGQSQINTVQGWQQRRGQFSPCLLAYGLQLFCQAVLRLRLVLFALGEQLLEGS